MVRSWLGRALGWVPSGVVGCRCGEGCCPPPDLVVPVVHQRRVPLGRLVTGVAEQLTPLRRDPRRNSHDAYVFRRSWGRTWPIPVYFSAHAHSLRPRPPPVRTGSRCDPRQPRRAGATTGTTRYWTNSACCDPRQPRRAGATRRPQERAVRSRGCDPRQPRKAGATPFARAVRGRYNRCDPRQPRKAGATSPCTPSTNGAAAVAILASPERLAPPVQQPHPHRVPTVAILASPERLAPHALAFFKTLADTPGCDPRQPRKAGATADEQGCPGYPHWRCDHPVTDTPSRGLGTSRRVDTHFPSPTTESPPARGYMSRFCLKPAHHGPYFSLRTQHCRTRTGSGQYHWPGCHTTNVAPWGRIAVTAASQFRSPGHIRLFSTMRSRARPETSSRPLVSVSSVPSWS